MSDPVVPLISDPFSPTFTAPPAEVRRKLDETRRLIADDRLTGDDAQALAAWSAAQFWAHRLDGDRYLPESVTLLCELATHPDPALARPGRQAIFSLLVERLSDSFNPEYCAVYDRMFAEVVEFCRRLPAGRALDEALNGFGLHTVEDLLRRKRQLSAFQPRLVADPRRVRKALLFSRVTIGADVAVTSTLVAKVRQALPAAELVVIGPGALAQLYAGDDRIVVRPVGYTRDGGLIERLNAWLDLLVLVRAELAGLQPEEYLIVDPDSRLTQLGIFPVTERESRYFFFESRCYGRDGDECMGALTNRWANEVFSTNGVAYPALSLAAPDVGTARAVVARLRSGGARHVTTINFGVGGNAVKRLTEDFEHDLVTALTHSGSTVILARGVDDEERKRSSRLLAQLAAEGGTVAELSAPGPGPLPEIAWGSRVLAWEGSIGRYAALIAASDEYIGYDSGGQHISAALGVPTIDIFAHSPFPRFIYRWRPFGPGPVHVVDASQGKSGTDVLDEVMEKHGLNVGRMS